jgi:hypothetical protein
MEEVLPVTMCLGLVQINCLKVGAVLARFAIDRGRPAEAGMVLQWRTLLQWVVLAARRSAPCAHQLVMRCHRRNAASRFMPPRASLKHAGARSIVAEAGAAHRCAQGPRGPCAA